MERAWYEHEEGAIHSTAESSRRYSTLDVLRAAGHVVEPTGDVGVVQLIRRGPVGRWDAACDRRKGGRPSGIR
jgi:hypothetical protein